MNDPAVEERLRSLLTAAAAPTEPGELPGERQALSAFRAATHDRTRRSYMRSHVTSFRAAAAACAGVGALLVGGTAAAAAGALPGAAQDTAREMLAKVGVEVPGANEHSAGRADQRGPVEDDGLTTSEGQGDEVAELARETEPGPDHGGTVSQSASDGKAGGVEPGEVASEGKGAAVSGTATTTDSVGRDKGAEISQLASEGKAGGDASGSASTETETDGDDTAEQQTAGAEDRGAQQADEAGGGRSTAGTDHRP